MIQRKVSKGEFGTYHLTYQKKQNEVDRKIYGAERNRKVDPASVGSNPSSYIIKTQKQPYHQAAVQGMKGELEKT